MKFLYRLALTIFLVPGISAQDIPGFMYYPNKVNIINIDNNILMQSYDEFVFYNIDKKKVNSRVYFDPLYSNQFYSYRDIDNFTIRNNDLVYTDGTIIDIENWKYTKIVDGHRYTKVKPYGNDEFVGLIDKSLYKFRNDSSEKKELYSFNKNIKDYIASDDVIIWIDSDYNLRRNNSDDIIKTKLNLSRFKELKDFIIIYNSEELFIYNKKENSIFRFGSNINLLSANDNYIYVLVDLNITRVDLYDYYQVKNIDLFGNKVYSMTELEDGLLILTNEDKLLKINDKKEFISEVNYGFPLKAKLINNKLAVISFAVNSFWLKVYNEANVLEYERWFNYDVNQYEKLPFHMDDKGVYFIEEKNGSTKFVALDISDYSVKENLVNTGERVKIVNRIGNRLYYLTFDSTLISINILTDKIEFKKKLDFDINYIKLIDENEFWYLSREHPESYELGTYNISNDQRTNKLLYPLEIHETNYDFPIYIDNDLEYIISSSSSINNLRDIKNSKYVSFIANVENDSPFPLMPYRLDDNKFIVFYENGDIMNYSFTNHSETRAFSDEIKTYTLRKELSVLKDDFYRLNISDMDFENKRMIYNTNGSIIRKNYTLSSVLSDDIPNQSKFVAYPQPANMSVTIEFDSQKYSLDKKDIAIYNIEGREIKNQDVKINNNSIIWDCSSALPGIYLINIKHGTEEKAVKVVVE